MELPSENPTPKISEVNVSFDLISKMDNIACNHPEIIFSETNINNCSKCGAYLGDNQEVCAIKSRENQFVCNVPVDHVYQSLLKNLHRSGEYVLTAQELQVRDFIVERVIAYADALKMSKTTVHLAVIYVDLVLSKRKEIIMQHPELWSASCLSLAAKAIEIDNRIPAHQTFVHMLGQRITCVELKITERILLRMLDWKLLITTPFDLISYYVSLGLVFTSDEVEGQNSKYEKDFVIDYTVAPKADESCDNTVEPPNTPEVLEEEGGSTLIEGHELSPVGQLDLELAYEKVLNENDRVVENDDESQIEKEVAKPDYFVSRFNTSQSNEKDNYRNSLELLTPKIERQAMMICDDLLRDNDLMMKDLRIVAASCVAYARSLENLEPWNHELQRLSHGLQKYEIEQVLSYLQNKFNSKYKIQLLPRDNTAVSTILEANAVRESLPCDSLEAIPKTETNNVSKADGPDPKKVCSGSQIMLRRTQSTLIEPNLVGNGFMIKRPTQPAPVLIRNKDIFNNLKMVEQPKMPMKMSKPSLPAMPAPQQEKKIISCRQGPGLWEPIKKLINPSPNISINNNPSNKAVFQNSRKDENLKNIKSQPITFIDNSKLGPIKPTFTTNPPRPEHPGIIAKGIRMGGVPELNSTGAISGNLKELRTNDMAFKKFFPLKK